MASDGEKRSRPGEADAVVVSEFQGWGEAEIGLGEADWIFEGLALDDQLGRNTRSAGDIDGDGLSDLLLTAHGEIRTMKQRAHGENIGSLLMYGGKLLNRTVAC